MKLFIAAGLLSLLATAAHAKFNTKDPAINEFAKEFTDRLRDNLKAQEVFSVTLLPADVAGGAYQKELLKYLKMQGDPLAGELSRQIGAAVAKYFHQISPTRLLSIMGYNFGYALSLEGKLDPGKVPELVSDAVQDFLSVVGDVSTPGRKVRAIFDAYEKFFARFGYKIKQLSKIFVQNAVDLFDS